MTKRKQDRFDKMAIKLCSMHEEFRDGTPAPELCQFCKPMARALRRVDKAAEKRVLPIELRLALLALADRWQAERAHTYSSENADHYRGFDAGRLRSAQELRTLVAKFAKVKR